MIMPGVPAAEPESREKVLVVDDSEAGRYIKSHVLRHAGYSVLEAATGRSGLKLVADENPSLVVLDVKLPDINGIEVCRRIKADNPSILVLQTSAAFLGKPDRALGFAGGADSYLIEPLEAEELTATVEALLRLSRAEHELHQARDELEDKVTQRTKELAEANDQLRAEIKRRAEAEDTLRHTQKLDVLGQLTGGIAHDFNNLLTIILGNLESLRRHLAQGKLDRSSIEKYSGNALYGAQRAIGVTQHLLAFSRRQALDSKVVNINVFVTEITQLLRQALGEKIQLELNLGDSPWPMLVDRNQLEVAALNLAVNARDAMPAGGRLIIETTNETSGDADYVVLSVRDTGVGMSADVLKYAFEPFFTTKGVGQGTGLGLAQVYGFVNQSGGHVTIDSTPRKGTTVKLFLPRYSGMADDVSHPETVMPEIRDLTGAAILLVEDNDKVREHSAELLRELGCQVVEAASGHEALALLDAHHEINLLFTDVGLAGGMNGPHLANAARDRRPGLKVLFTSGYARNTLLKEGLPETAALLRKPFTFGGLAEAVGRLVAESSASTGEEIKKEMKKDPGRFLLVEDEALIRMNTAEGLQDLGFEVEVAGTAAEAMTKMHAHQGAFRAVVIDIGLPDRNGDLLAADIRAAHPSLPLILATGYETSDLRQRFKNDPHVAFVAKPYQIDDIARTADGLRGAC
jgi:CheY-like chemotaxis protein